MTAERMVSVDETSKVPEVVVSRLPQYVRALTRLSEEGISVVSSHQLGDMIQMTPAQIRKDLSYFGRFGKQGRGYVVKFLLRELRGILGLDREWNVLLVGVGRLGRAILGYPGFAPEGFNVVAAFDADPRQVGQMVAGIMVQPMRRLADEVRRLGIRIAIVAVPIREVQEVVEHLVQCDVRAIVNYAPTNPQVPQHVKVRNIDPVLALQSMTFYLSSPEEGMNRNSHHGARPA